MSNDLFRFSTTIEVRWRDLDALNHVNNAVYFTFLEHGRVRYLQELELISEITSDIGFILAEAQCQFRSPLTLGELVTVYVRVSELRNSSFVFKYRMEGEGQRLAAEASSTQVCYDYENKRPIPIPDRWREAIVDFEPGLPTWAGKTI
jgi:acyl-CoA thioester hydrolase